jgi:hypothetical protein
MGKPIMFQNPQLHQSHDVPRPTNKAPSEHLETAHHPSTDEDNIDLEGYEYLEFSNKDGNVLPDDPPCVRPSLHSAATNPGTSQSAPTLAQNMLDTKSHQINDLRKAQRADPLLCAVIDYVNQRAAGTELPLKSNLSQHRLPDQVINIVHQKRNLFFISKDDILHINSQDPEEAHLVVIPASLVNTILHLAHDNRATLHPGIMRTKLILWTRVWWPTMNEDIETYVRSCNTCSIKDCNPVNNAPLGVITSDRDKPKLTFWFCDILSLPASSLQWKHLLTMMDYKTGWLEAYRLPNDKAETIVNTLQHDFATRYAHGCTLQIDQGSSFMSHTFNRVCHALNYIPVQITAYNTKANSVERAHCELNAKLRILLKDQPVQRWSQELDKAVMAYRITPNSNGISPYQAVYGNDSTLPIDIYLRTAFKSLTTHDACFLPPTVNAKKISSVLLQHLEPLEILDSNDATESPKHNHKDLDTCSAPRNHTNSHTFPSPIRMNADTERREQFNHHDNHNKSVYTSMDYHNQHHIDHHTHQVDNHIWKQHAQNQTSKSVTPILFNFCPGDKVDLWRPLDFRNPQKGCRFTRHWSGPYEVVNHDWNKPWRVMIQNFDKAWSKAVFVNHIRHHFRTPIKTTYVNFWLPYALPLKKPALKRGHKPSWIEREWKVNQLIDEKTILEANQPPSGQWETEEKITQQYHKAYPHGFPTRSVTEPWTKRTPNLAPLLTTPVAAIPSCSRKRPLDPIPTQVPLTQKKLRQ